MKRFKYILPVILLMLLSVFTVEKAQAEILSGQAGDNAYWSYDTDTDTLSITGEGDLYNTSYIHTETYDIFENTKVLKIGKDIDYIGQHTFSALDPDNNVKAIIYGDMDNFAGGSLSFVSTIVLHGNAETLGQAVNGWPVKKVKKSSDNDKVSIKNGMVMSADETTLYFYFGKKKKLTIPDSVETIREMAFATNETLSKVTLGKNVTTISDRAFQSSSVKTLVCNDKLKTIGIGAFNYCSLKHIYNLSDVKLKTGAFQYSKLKSVTLGKGVKVGVMSFGAKTTIIPECSFKKVRVSVAEAEVWSTRDSNGKKARKIKLKWTAVEGAEGYEVILKQGSAKMRWTQTSNKKTIVTRSFKHYDDYFVYYGYTSSYDPSTVSNPIYVKVRAYKTNKNGEKVYTKWNAEQIVEFPGE